MSKYDYAGETRIRVPAQFGRFSKQTRPVQSLGIIMYTDEGFWYYRTLDGRFLVIRRFEKNEDHAFHFKYMTVRYITFSELPAEIKNGIKKQEYVLITKEHH